MSGQKVTNDPEAFKQPIHEGVGILISDSLAADSIRDGGDFADGRAGISGQKSTGSTAANTDTTNARRLDPASDAEARMAEEEWNENSQLNAAKGLGKDVGNGPTYNTSSGSDDYDKPSLAPYATTHHVDASTQKPKGKNIEEGGFDENAPNASFKYDIGSKNDPGLAGEQKFERANADNAGFSGFPKDTEMSKGGEYDSLNRNEEA